MDSGLSKIQDEYYWKNRPLTDKQKDWNYGEENWLEGYSKSINHPHRKLIIDALQKLEPFDSLLEVGCNVGPNLYNIKTRFPNVKLAGIDVNENAIITAQTSPSLSGIRFEIGSAYNIPYPDKSFDIVLSDAVLIYTNPDRIQHTMAELSRVACKGMILVEWYNPNSTLGTLMFGHWARNYQKILEEKNFEVKKIKIKKGTWKTKSGNWETIGYVFVASRPVLQISNTNYLLERIFQSGTGGKTTMTV